MQREWANAGNDGGRDREKGERPQDRTRMCALLKQVVSLREPGR